MGFFDWFRKGPEDYRKAIRQYQGIKKKYQLEILELEQEIKRTTTDAATILKLSKKEVKSELDQLVHAEVKDWNKIHALELMLKIFSIKENIQEFDEVIEDFKKGEKSSKRA